jgi:predicted translin family RNA/ssDNA-binding protein
VGVPSLFIINIHDTNVMSETIAANMATRGQKRDYEGNSVKMSNSTVDAPRTRFTAMFEGFRDELDEHHSRRERVIKASRDITALSKKIIFALQRVKDINGPLPPGVSKTVAMHTDAITALLASVAPDLEGINRHRYAWQLRGLEELVEAMTLAHYLTSQTLLPPDGVATSLPAGLVPTTHDYLNGVMDLFGEMMRFATVLATRDATMVGGGGGGAQQRRTILEDMHVLGSCVEMLPHISGTSWEGKVKTMRTSVAKVEKLGYGIAIRGNERPGWEDEEV